MATGATFRDLLVFLAVGREDATRQRGYIAMQSQLAGKRDCAQTGFGRPYHAHTRIGSYDQVPLLRRLFAVAAWLAKPFRMIASLGEYDARSTR